jgi:hypothetical protein
VVGLFTLKNGAPVGTLELRTEDPYQVKYFYQVVITFFVESMNVYTTKLQVN